jgi:hypothetical protein
MMKLFIMQFSPFSCHLGLTQTITALMERESRIVDSIFDDCWRVIRYLPSECSSDVDMITVSLVSPELPLSCKIVKYDEDIPETSGCSKSSIIVFHGRENIHLIY